MTTNTLLHVPIAATATEKPRLNEPLHAQPSLQPGHPRLHNTGQLKLQRPTSNSGKLGQAAPVGSGQPAAGQLR